MNRVKDWLTRGSWWQAGDGETEKGMCCELGLVGSRL